MQQYLDNSEQKIDGHCFVHVYNKDAGGKGEYSLPVGGGVFLGDDVRGREPARHNALESKVTYSFYFLHTLSTQCYSNQNIGDQWTNSDYAFMDS